MDKVSILCGGISSEDYLSRRSAEFIYPNLFELGYEVEVLDWHKEGFVNKLENPNGQIVHRWNSINECLLEYKDGLIFNLLHGEMESAGQLQGCLDLLNIPFTGNSLSSSVVGMDKMLSKDLFRRLNLHTPRDFFIGYIHHIDVDKSLERIFEDGFSYPFMLKSSHGGSSEGVALIEDRESYHRVINKWKKHVNSKHCPLFAEEFIEGEEFCLGLFGHWSGEITPLPIAKILFDGKYFNKEIKESNKYYSSFDFDLDESISKLIIKAGCDIHHVLKFTGFSRIDFIVDKMGRPNVLEVNTHPGMGSHSIIPNMIKNCSCIDIKDALKKMLLWAEN